MLAAYTRPVPHLARTLCPRSGPAGGLAGGHLPASFRARRVLVTRAGANGETVRADELPPAGCERVRLQLRKPLGLVLEANKTGSVFVVEVLPEGNAAKDGRIEAGDEVISTSAVVYDTERDYGGVAVKGGQRTVRLVCKSEKFDTGAWPTWCGMQRAMAC
jgi:hypothetical protein